jgi:hypothetical protein
MTMTPVAEARPATAPEDAALLIEEQEAAAECSRLLDLKLAAMSEFSDVAEALATARLRHDGLRAKVLHEGLEPVGVLDSFESRFLNDHGIRSIRNRFSTALNYRG